MIPWRKSCHAGCPNRSRGSLPKSEGREAILVFAYDDEATFQKMRLEMAISLGDFQKRLAELSKEQVIIFYCA